MGRLRCATSVWGWFFGGALVLGVWGAESVRSADSPTAGVEAKVPRLPNHFAKLSLSEEQRTKVQATQLKYAKEIDELKSRLKKLQGEQQKELESVLTAEQQSRLKLLKGESRKKSSVGSAQKKP